MRKWLVPTVVILILALLAWTARQWLPVVLPFLETNTNRLQSLASIVQMILWGGAGGVFLWRLLRNPTPSLPPATPILALPEPGPPAVPPRAAAPAPAATLGRFDGDWPALAACLQVGGFVQQFMHQSELIEADGLRFKVRVPIRPLAEPATVNRVRDALGAHLGAPVRSAVAGGAVVAEHHHRHRHSGSDPDRC